MYKFYYLEDMTQEELNKLALERNDLEKENHQLKKQKDDVVEYIKNTYNNITKLGKRDLLRMLGERDE